MGFLDKAKKMAEQAQAKLDEVQQQFNESQSKGSAPQGPAVEYDKHGRPIQSEAPPQPSAPPAPHGDPVAEAPPAPTHGDTAAEAPPAAETPPSAPDAAAPVPDPAAPAPEPPPEEDRNNPSYAPPKLTGGDPLAG
jgi:hypothetical protein